MNERIEELKNKIDHQEQYLQTKLYTDTWDH